MSTGLDHHSRLEISELLVRYARGIDGRDWELFRSCFTDDFEGDYGRMGVWHGGDDITADMKRTHEHLGATMHRITNISITGENDSATARAYVDTLVMDADNTSVTKAVGFYDDELRRGDDGWKISRRTFTPVLVQPRLPLTVPV